ncbi:4-hydroxyphenylacetate 3-hydroxylase [Mycolicibacterium fortuitum subsp. fortuitum DSM 46621 = ATCC 6841 = JCM 6387]|nr:4-hydroxyphenylacetate 3-hydroxylase [Mycolicibacterium fortuitum subsp. fortuitum DSM 46621 = ATCC 6841 = JCM 6387]
MTGKPMVRNHTGPRRSPITTIGGDGMAARTGKEYISGLRDGREVWIGGQRVSDVTEYEPFAGAVQSVAGLYDLQHDHADDCLFAHPETGELTNISHLIPRSREDIARRGTALAHAARYSVGLLGRSPDYVNVSLAGHAGRSDVWSRNGNEEGAANLVRFQADLARDDLALTHAIIRPTVDKGIGDLAAADGQMALHKVADTADGIVVRGAMVLSTLAPFSDEVAVYPGQPLPKDAQKYAIAFSAPIASPGLKLLCRDAFSTDMAHFDAPFSGRFDEQDAFLIFDDVEIPRSRVFIDGNTEVWNAAMMNGWTANIMQQTTIRAEAKLRFAYELVSRFCKSINASDPRTKELLGELWTYAEMTRALLVAAEAGAREWGQRHLVLRRATVPGAASDVATVVPPGERDHQAARLPQPARHPIRSRLRQSGTTPLAGQVPAGRGPVRREGTCAAVPGRLGFRRDRTGRTQRTVRTVLPRLGRTLLSA